MLKWRESVRSDKKRASSTREDCADKINMEACLNTVSAADVTLMKFRRQLPESGQNPHRRKVCEVFKWRRTKVHPWRQSSARECPTKPRETGHSQEL